MSLSIIIFPVETDRPVYVGACVERYIVTQGNTLEDVHYSMETMFAAYASLAAEQGLPPLSDLPPAPSKFRKAFMAAPERLDFEYLEFRVGAANDSKISEAVESIRGPRHYRYTSEAPPEDPLPDWLT